MKSSRFATTPDRRLIVHVPQLESLLREAERPPRLVGGLIGLREPRPLDALSPQVELVCGVALPAAPLTRRLDRPDDHAGAWLRADPIGLMPDLAAVWLQAERRFEPGGWTQELKRLFEEEGLSLELTPSGRGYLRLEHVPECRFTPPWLLAGNSLEHCLPRGPGARAWRRLLNETQVTLQQLRRDASTPASIPGSLWFWGGGVLPDTRSVEPRVHRIEAEDPVLRGLADWLDLQPRDDELPPATRGGRLIEWSPRFEDSAEANLERLETLLRPVWRRLRIGSIREFELAGIEGARRYGVSDAWRVWR